jgi:hypothetical protein
MRRFGGAWKTTDSRNPSEQAMKASESQIDKRSKARRCNLDDPELSTSRLLLAGD